MPAAVAVVPMQLDETLAGLIFSGILEKRPRIKFVMGEAGLGWIPYVIERLDHELHKYGSKIKDHKIEMLPSEIFARQVFTTYEDEKLGVELIPRIGVDNVMWASDYPHGDSTWPHSRKALAESPLAQHGPEVLRKVTCENAARVYGFRVEDDHALERQGGDHHRRQSGHRTGVRPAIRPGRGQGRHRRHPGGPGPGSGAGDREAGK